MYWLKIALFSILDREESDSNNYIIAKYLLENYNDLPGVSLTEISRQCNLSKAAVSRFCKELGLMDYIDLQMLIRGGNQKAEKTGASLSAEEQKLQFFDKMDTYVAEFKTAMNDPLVEELIADIGTYRQMYAFGHLQASHIAYTLGNNLAMNGIFCFCTQSWTEQADILNKARSDSLFIIFSVTGDYFKRLDLNMHFLEKPDAPKVYLITFDETPSPYQRLIKIRLGTERKDLFANISMNLFVNYIAERDRKR